MTTKKKPITNKATKLTPGDLADAINNKMSAQLYESGMSDSERLSAVHYDRLRRAAVWGAQLYVFGTSLGMEDATVTVIRHEQKAGGMR